MHEALRLYDASIAILAQEAEALESEDAERLMELCQNRARLMDEAWSKRAGCPADSLLERLEVIRKAQETIIFQTKTQTETLRLDLKNNRQESTRLAGYGRMLGNGQNMSLLYKEG